MIYPRPRRATLDDLDVLVHHRVAMYTEIGKPRDASFDAMARNTRDWIGSRLAAGTFHAYVVAAPDSGEIVAGSGLYLADWPPTHRDPGTVRGIIFNVYVEPEHRRRGLGRAVTEACIAAARARGIRVITLNASDAGRPMYERLGFTGTSEMRLQF